MELQGLLWPTNHRLVFPERAVFLGNKGGGGIIILKPRQALFPEVGTGANLVLVCWETHISFPVIGCLIRVFVSVLRL